MRIAIVGSRSLRMDGLDSKQFFTSLVSTILHEAIFPGAIIVSGGADGVDSVAEGLAKGYGNPVLIFRPEWGKYGKSAGFKRNQKIVDAADEIIAFHIGDSPGTADTIRRAKEAKKPLTIYTPTVSDAGILSFGIARFNHV